MRNSLHNIQTLRMPRKTHLACESPNQSVSYMGFFFRERVHSIKLLNTFNLLLFLILHKVRQNFRFWELTTNGPSYKIHMKETKKKSCNSTFLSVPELLRLPNIIYV